MLKTLGKSDQALGGREGHLEDALHKVSVEEYSELRRRWGCGGGRYSKNRNEPGPGVGRV